MFVTSHHSGCKCIHHTLVSVLMILTWVSAIGYFIASWFGGYLYVFDSQYFFEVVVILSLIVLSTKFCNCCQEMHHKDCADCMPSNGSNGKMMCCLDDKGNCMHSK